jgi:hypothetical protein
MASPDRKVPRPPGADADDGVRQLADRIASLEEDLLRASVARSARDAEIRRLRVELTQRDEELAAARRGLRWPAARRGAALVRALAGAARHGIVRGLARVMPERRGTGRAPPPSTLSPEEQRRLIAASGLFDAAWYLDRYPDVAGAGMDPMRHYVEFGAAEGRDPGPGFDTAFYLRSYPDVAARAVNPLLDYIERGAREGRRTRPDSPADP